MILDPLHPAVSTMIEANMRPRRVFSSKGTAIDHKNDWAYILGTPDGGRATVLKRQFGDGIYFLNLGYFRYALDDPRADFVVRDSLEYLLQNDISVAPLSHRRFTSTAVSTRVSNIVNNPDRSEDEIRVELTRIISAMKQGAGLKGSLQDKAIEALVEYATPDADEGTRRVQRDAVKLVFERDEEESAKLWVDIVDAVRAKPGNN